MPPPLRPFESPVPIRTYPNPGVGRFWKRAGDERTVERRNADEEALATFTRELRDADDRIIRAWSGLRYRVNKRWNKQVVILVVGEREQVEAARARVPRVTRVTGFDVPVRVICDGDGDAFDSDLDETEEEKEAARARERADDDSWRWFGFESQKAMQDYWDAKRAMAEIEIEEERCQLAKLGITMRLV